VLETVDDALGMVWFKSPRMVIEAPGGPALRVALARTIVSMSSGGMGMDDDFEPVEKEAGAFLRFVCHGDSRVRRFFHQRSIIDGKTFAPREHTWVVVDGDGGKAGIKFLGRLYDYRSRPINANKAIEISGRILVSPPRAGQ